MQPDDVAGVCLVDHRFFLGHEGRGRRELDRFARRHVQVGLVALEATRADFQKRDPVAVVRVHVRMDLEHESGQFLLVGRHVALERMRLAGRRRDTDEAVEQLADSEIVQCAAEKDRRDLALAVAVEFERRINAFDELQIVAQVLCERIDVLVDRRVVELYVERLSFGRLPVFGEEQRKPVGVQVVHALERRTRADRPGQRPDLNLQLALDLVEQVERVLARAVELVDEDHDRRVAHPAYFHQLARLRLDALSAVDHDDHAVDGRQRPVGVLGEVLVAGGVEDVDLDVSVLEAHDRRGDRDAALPLDFHEVGRGSPLDLVRLDGSRHMDRAAEEQQLFGQRRLARVRVADDGEGSPALYFLFQFHRFSLSFAGLRRLPRRDSAAALRTTIRPCVARFLLFSVARRE